MYRDKFRFSAQPATVALGKPDFPQARSSRTNFSGRSRPIAMKWSIRVPVKADGPFTLQAQSQGCADAGRVLHAREAIRTAGSAAAERHRRPSERQGGVMSKLRHSRGGKTAETNFLPLDQAFKVTVTAREGKPLVAELKPAESYYLYRDKISFARAEGSRSLDRQGRIASGRKEVAIPISARQWFFTRPSSGDHPGSQRRSRGAHPCGSEIPGMQRERAVLSASQEALRSVLAAWQPARWPQDVASPRTAPQRRCDTGQLRSDRIDSVQVTSRVDLPADENSNVAQIFKAGHFWFIVASFFGFGLLLSLTPCVFPMIPILSGIIVGQGRRSPRATPLRCR